MRQNFKVIFVIIATLIGAGFASGQEINVFFYSYGLSGILGLLVCSILLIYIIYKVLKIINCNNINSYKEFVSFLVNNSGKNKYFNISFIINTIVNLFLLVTFFIMIAGFGAYFSQELGVSSYVGSGCLALLCFITLMFNANGVIKVSSFLVPILIIFIIAIGAINFNEIDLNLLARNLSKSAEADWLLSSILYCSYNSILLIPVLITLKKFTANSKDILVNALVSGTIIFVLGLAIFGLLGRISYNVENLEMPVVYVISNYFSSFKFIYAFIILSSIYTTAISIGVSFLENINNSNKKKYIVLALALCIGGFLASGLGFSNLISLLYPIFGYLGVIQIAKIF